MGFLFGFVVALLFFVLFFGIAFIINMLLRATWLLAFIYPIIVILIIDDLSFWRYFTSPGSSFSALGDRLVNLETFDVIVLISGLLGTLLAGYVIKLLRKKGYQMF
ncbi:YuiB family protein [Aquisalibacillus elongatus]|uniref:YuiB-like putative membrane protein n=1 Tax=Aquisalibacillus elongatus TaxID=485577 RepID=A0A3N5AZD4_9BACI|nr:YuiB family protein [Aquisalibacillus elongatus]RPF50313.1 YuiB-like putative membrane protein [Aquisalibacillus elongatus]